MRRAAIAQTARTSRLLVTALLVTVLLVAALQASCGGASSSSPPATRSTIAWTTGQRLHLQLQRQVLVDAGKPLQYRAFSSLRGTERLEVMSVNVRGEARLRVSLESFSWVSKTTPALDAAPPPWEVAVGPRGEVLEGSFWISLDGDPPAPDSDLVLAPLPPKRAVPGLLWTSTWDRRRVDGQPATLSTKGTVSSSGPAETTLLADLDREVDDRSTPQYGVLEHLTGRLRARLSTVYDLTRGAVLQSHAHSEFDLQDTVSSAGGSESLARSGFVDVSVKLEQ